MLPAEFSSQILEVVEDYASLRKKHYQLEIDPFIAEAVTDQAIGDSAKMDALIAIKEAIRLQFPKPE